MASSFVTIVEQTIEVADVLDVIVTTIEQDAAGDYVREIRFFGTPREGLTGIVQTLAVRIKSAAKVNLEITTPALAM